MRCTRVRLEVDDLGIALIEILDEATPSVAQSLAESLHRVFESFVDVNNLGVRRSPPSLARGPTHTAPPLGCRDDEELQEIEAKEPTSDGEANDDSVHLSDDVSRLLGRLPNSDRGLDRGRSREWPSHQMPEPAAHQFGRSSRRYRNAGVWPTCARPVLTDPQDAG